MLLLLDVFQFQSRHHRDVQELSVLGRLHDDSILMKLEEHFDRELDAVLPTHGVEVTNKGDERE